MNGYIPKVPEYPPREHYSLDPNQTSPNVEKEAATNSNATYPLTNSSVPFPFNSDVVLNMNHHISTNGLPVDTLIREHVTSRMPYLQLQDARCPVDQMLSINIPNSETNRVATPTNDGEQSQKCFGDHVNGIIEKECMDVKPKLIPAECLPLRKRTLEIDEAPAPKLPRLIRADQGLEKYSDMYQPGSPPKIGMISQMMIPEHENLRQDIFDNSRRGSLLSNGDESHSASASSTPSTARSQSPPPVDNYLLPLKQLDADRPEPRDLVGLYQQGFDFNGVQKIDKATLDFQRCMSEALEKQRAMRNRSDSFGSVCSSQRSDSFGSTTSQEDLLAKRQAVNERLAKNYRTLTGQLQRLVGSDSELETAKMSREMYLPKLTNGAISYTNSQDLNQRFANQLQQRLKISPQKQFDTIRTQLNSATVNYTQSIKDLVHASAVSNLKEKLLQKSDSSENLHRNGQNTIQRTYGDDVRFQTMRNILNSQKQVSTSGAPAMLGPVYQPSTSNGQPPFYPYMYSQYPAIAYPYRMMQQLQAAQMQKQTDQKLDQFQSQKSESPKMPDIEAMTSHYVDTQPQQMSPVRDNVSSPQSVGSCAAEIGRSNQW
jgi:hypothetical protein